MKTLLPVLMLALTLITDTGRAKIPSEHAMKLSSPDIADATLMGMYSRKGGKR